MFCFRKIIHRLFVYILTITMWLNHFIFIFGSFCLNPGALHTRRTWKSSNGKKVLCVYHRLNRWQAYQSAFWHMLGDWLFLSLFFLFTLNSNFILFNALSIFLYPRTTLCNWKSYLVFQCTSAIEQLTKGRNKEDRENSQLASLSAMALGKDYKQRAPNKVSMLSSTLRSLKLSS